LGDYPEGDWLTEFTLIGGPSLTLAAGTLALKQGAGRNRRLATRPRRKDNPVKLIALEEAFWYDKLSNDGTPDALIPVKPEVIAGWRRRLPDFTEYRLPDMDKHGIDMQVLSLTATGLQTQPDTQTAVTDAGVANDFLAAIISEHPGRFQGLAAVPLQDPRQAAAELRRAVQDLGLCAGPRTGPVGAVTLTVHPRLVGR
jgi:predicted TIM-barrel fold metal-dependent hydrolase